MPLFMFQVMGLRKLTCTSLMKVKISMDRLYPAPPTPALPPSPALPPTPALPALAPPPALLQLAPHLLLAPPSALLQLAPAPTHVTGETCHCPKPHLDVIVTFHDFVQWEDRLCVCLHLAISFTNHLYLYLYLSVKRVYSLAMHLRYLSAPLVQRASEASEADSQSCSIEISDIYTSGVLEHKWRVSLKLHYC